jgi:hypothetical protein
MKQMDYSVSGSGAKRTITPRSERAKKRTTEVQEFADNASALEFVDAGVAEGYRFSGREIVDHKYKLVKYGYFVRTDDGQFVRCGQDWGPPDPVFEPGDIYPGGPRAGRHADIVSVVTGDEAKKNGVSVMMIVQERDVSKMN